MIFQPSQSARLLLLVVVLAISSRVQAQQYSDLSELQQEKASKLRKVPSSRQEDDIRQLGTVIDISGNNGNDISPIKTTFEAPDYSQELPMILTGPYGSDTVIDVEAVTSSSNGLMYSDRVVGGKGSDPRSYYAMLLYRDTAGWKFAGCGGKVHCACKITLSISIY
mgnify:CR=1 FL=1